MWMKNRLKFYNRSSVLHNKPFIKSNKRLYSALKERLQIQNKVISGCLTISIILWNRGGEEEEEEEDR